MSEKIIGVVGPCASGKSTLLRGLSKHGIMARHIAQEHSFVPDMWLVLTNPDVLIYLMVSYEQSLTRNHLHWTRKEYEEQISRLSHAYANANLVLDTGFLTTDQVLACALEFIHRK